MRPASPRDTSRTRYASSSKGIHAIELIGRGRDADVFALDDRRVLRRYRSGRSAEHEAAVMEHARKAGYPVPEVLDASGPDLTLQRVTGRTMADDLKRGPWRIWSHAKLLADLHRRLHAIDAPDGLRAPLGEGTALLHLDLHPENVLVSRDGPWVIDWANAARGPAEADVALTFVIVGVVPQARSPIDRLGDALRKRFAAEFLIAADMPAVRGAMPLALEFRLADANLLPEERAALLVVAARARSVL